jgi:aldehyde dehydrogenase (NAD+)
MSSINLPHTPTELLAPFSLSQKQLGIWPLPVSGEAPKEWLSTFSPVDGCLIAEIASPCRSDYDSLILQSVEAFNTWRLYPAPRRGEIVRQIGQSFRDHKKELGTLVSYEMGKSLQEGMGEVQEMIDICDFAVGLSRQLHGLSMHSERPGHRMYEQWHPLGPVGIISAFNFPVAVWSWNAMLAMVCGNTTVWKPSEKTPVSALACIKIASAVLTLNNLPQAICSLVTGGRDTGEWLASDPRIPLVSATGSVRMGKALAKTVASRLGRSILELGGNNAIIITQHADLDLALTACLFGAIGTAGQRCTTTRRLIIHQEVYEKFRERLVRAYGQLKIGNPLEEKNHMGPLIDQQAVSMYLKAIEEIKKQGGRFVVEGKKLEGQGFESGCYVSPSIAETTHDLPMVQQETFAPILYLIRYDNLEEAIHYQNEVPQGLSSAIITTDLRDSEKFLAASGSDCGIANVNIGTSGAEIGGAFGGEKETGGGRESGSDAWKNYMRRQTSTINFSESLPLAQGIQFDLT